jgi:hypothetical protein
MNIAGIAAISAQVLGSRDLKSPYAIQKPHIIIHSCFKLSHKSIGSSFSI